MATLTETPTYTSGIYQLETTDPVDAGTGGSGVSNQQAKELANRTAWLKQFVITGEVRSFAFSGVPTGFLVCDGSPVSRTTYADLYAVIGVTFGPGNGSTTFNLPDLRGKFIRGWSNLGPIDGSRVFGSTQAATTIGDHVTLFGSSEIRIPIANPDSGSGASVTHGTAAGTISSSQQTYSTRPDNVAMLFAIKT